MKNFLTTILFLVAGASFGQVHQTDPAYGRNFQRVIAGTLQFQTGCGAPSLNSTQTKIAAIAFDSCNNKLYYYNPKLSVWAEMITPNYWTLNGSDIYRNSNVGIGITAPTSKLHLSASLSTTADEVSGILLSNPTAATNGNQKISPALWLKGNGWREDNSAPGSPAPQSQPFAMGFETRPIQGSNDNPEGELRILHRVNNGSITSPIQFGYDGEITSIGGMTLGGNLVFSGAAYITYHSSRDTNNFTNYTLIDKKYFEDRIAALSGSGGSDDLGDVTGRDSTTTHSMTVMGSDKFLGISSSVAFGSAFLNQNETVGGFLSMAKPGGQTLDFRVDNLTGNRTLQASNVSGTMWVKEDSTTIHSLLVTNDAASIGVKNNSTSAGAYIKSNTANGGYLDVRNPSGGAVHLRSFSSGTGLYTVNLPARGGTVALNPGSSDSVANPINTLTYNSATGYIQKGPPAYSQAQVDSIVAVLRQNISDSITARVPPEFDIDMSLGNYTITQPGVYVISNSDDVNTISFPDASTMLGKEIILYDNSGMDLTIPFLDHSPRSLNANMTSLPPSGLIVMRAMYANGNNRWYVISKNL